MGHQSKKSTRLPYKDLSQSLSVVKDCTFKKNKKSINAHYTSACPSTGKWTHSMPHDPENETLLVSKQHSGRYPLWHRWTAKHSAQSTQSQKTMLCHNSMWNIPSRQINRTNQVGDHGVCITQRDSRIISQQAWRNFFRVTEMSWNYIKVMEWNLIN